MSLRNRTLSPVFWSSADVFARQGLSVVTSIILARLLTPEHFGTIGLLYLFTGIAGVFVDGGFSAALIQRRDASRTDESTVFWFNLGMGLVVAAALLLSAPLFVHFYDLPILAPLTAVLALNVLIVSAGSIHCTLLAKSLSFGKLMTAGVIATVLSGGIAIALAAQGWGVWALAAQTVTATVVNTVLLWTLSSWRPTFVFSGASARSLFGFGGYVSASSFAEVAHGYLYYVMIGKLFGVADLGSYERADSTRQVPVGLLSHIVLSVSFPTFAAVAQDVTLLRSTVRRAIMKAMFVNAPLMLMIALGAEFLVNTLLGRQWAHIVPVFQVLCLGSLLWPVYTIHSVAVLARGHSDVYFGLGLATKIAGCLFIAVGVCFGIIGVAWSQVAFGIFSSALSGFYIKRYLRYGPMQQLGDCAPALLCSALMALVVVVIGAKLPLHDAAGLAVAALMGAAVYLSISAALQVPGLKDVMASLLRPRSPGAAAHRIGRAAE